MVLLFLDSRFCGHDHPGGVSPPGALRRPGQKPGRALSPGEKRQAGFPRVREGHLGLARQGRDRLLHSAKVLLCMNVRCGLPFTSHHDLLHSAKVLLCMNVRCGLPFTSHHDLLHSAKVLLCMNSAIRLNC